MFEFICDYHFEGQYDAQLLNDILGLQFLTGFQDGFDVMRIILNHCYRSFPNESPKETQDFGNRFYRLDVLECVFGD